MIPLSLSTISNKPTQFGMYIFFPIGWMYYFGTNLDQRFSVPDFWPAKEATNTIPFEREDITAELERLRAKRLEVRNRRLAVEGAAGANGEQGVRDLADMREAGVLGEQRAVQGESAILKSLGNAEASSARAGAAGEMEEKQRGGKGWKFW